MSLETVRGYPAPEPTPEIRIDFSPHGEAFSFNVGEAVYHPPNVYYAAVNSTLTFTATTHFPVSTRQPIAYTWEFGDGSIGYGNPVTHPFPYSGSFVVHLAVTDNHGKVWRANKTMYLQWEDPPANKIAPVASGKTIVEQTLSVTKGSWEPEPTGYAYKWERAATSGFASPTVISGATSQTYTLVPADAEKYIRCTVTATNGTGSVGKASNVLGPISELVAPVNTSAPVVPSTVFYSEESIRTTNGKWEYSPTNYTYQWQLSEDGSNWSNVTLKGNEDINGQGTSEISFTSEAYVNWYFRCVVTAVNVRGSTSANSNACRLRARIQIKGLNEVVTAAVGIYAPAIPAPTHNVGDALLCSFCLTNTGSSYTMPAMTGWTKVTQFYGRTATAGQVAFTEGLYARVADGTSADNFPSWEWGGYSPYRAEIRRITGAFKPIANWVVGPADGTGSKLAFLDGVAAGNKGPGLALGFFNTEDFATLSGQVEKVNTAGWTLNGVETCAYVKRVASGEEPGSATFYFNTTQNWGSLVLFIPESES